MGYVHGPKSGAARSFAVSLVNVEDGQYAVNPTIVAGDWKISIAGGAFNALSNTPTVSPAGSTQVIVSLTAAEAIGPFYCVRFLDLTDPKEFMDNAWHCESTTVGSGSGSVITVNPSAFLDYEQVANLLGPYLANYLVQVIGGFTADQRAQILAMIDTLTAIKDKTDLLTFTSTALQVIVTAFNAAAQDDLRLQMYNMMFDTEKTIPELTEPIPENMTVAESIAWGHHFTRFGGTQNNTVRQVKNSGGIVIAQQPITNNGTSIDWEAFS